MAAVSCASWACCCCEMEGALLTVETVLAVRDTTALVGEPAAVGGAMEEVWEPEDCGSTALDCTCDDEKRTSTSLQLIDASCGLQSQPERSNTTKGRAIRS